MAIYRSTLGETEDKSIPRLLGQQFGLNRLDPNMLADDDGITSLQVVDTKQLRGYIPYSSRRLLWHTDGYYNPPERTIRAFILHCVRPSPVGGENCLLDPEIVFIKLMDEDPEIVRLLMEDDVMSIPANDEAPEHQRKERHGPVFALDQASGRLHMRYTHRVHSIEWKQDNGTRHAVERLKHVITNCNEYIFNYRLERGEVLICNNVLHSRTAFENGLEIPQQRLLYRARYYDPINEYIEIT
jgi:alpha-ketoglutarate-dependent taurine dioxygenase